MTELDLLNYDAGIDVPDENDLHAEEILDMVDLLPQNVMLDKTAPLNQGSIGACTVFWTSGALFETERHDAENNGAAYNPPYDPWKMWDLAKLRGASDTKGWTLQGAVSLVRDMKYTVGYARVAAPGNIDPTPIKRALANQYAVVTGSQYGDWSKIIDTGIYSEKKTPSGHVYEFNGYSDTYEFPNGEKWGFHSPNSWWGRGGFWIPYSMIGRLYSCYIQLGPSDAGALRDHRNALAKKYADLAQSKWFWNWQNGENIATPEEIRIMLSRALDIMGARTRQYWGDTFIDKIIKWKMIFSIWSEKDGKRNATNDELAVMFARAVLRDPTIQKSTLSRFQVATIIGRDFIPKI